MKKDTLVILCLLLLNSVFAQTTDSNQNVKVMVGFPPSRESQVTFGNYRDYPFAKWAFRNAGAPYNTLMIPRGGTMSPLKRKPDSGVAKIEVKNADGQLQTADAIFKETYTDGIIIMQNNNILYEKYYNGLKPDYQHIWFSVTKSITSAALGILVEKKLVDLSASPANYIAELKGTAFERVTLQDLLNQSTAIDFKENYADTASDFLKYYVPALNLGRVKGARDLEPKDATIYGVYDFVAKYIKPNNTLKPGEVFEYNSCNVDVVGWLIARVSGQSYVDFIRDNIWAKIGAEHDAYMAVDRAYMGVAAAGMNTTLRDAARFGCLILHRGYMNGQQIIPAAWVDETLKLSRKDKERYKRNLINLKANMPWVGYKNLWWILDEKKGEYAGIGVYGQMIYINRAANMVISFFSSQPVASLLDVNKPFLSKLYACRTIAQKFIKRK